MRYSPGSVPEPVRILKNTVSWSWPDDEEDDVMYSMLSIPLIWFSSGAATESASVLASAPGYWAETVICTGLMFGYCSTGNWVMAMPPARQIISETTIAKIGRSMKNLENIVHPLWFGRFRFGGIVRSVFLRCGDCSRVRRGRLLLVCSLLISGRCTDFLLLCIL